MPTAPQTANHRIKQGETFSKLLRFTTSSVPIRLEADVKVSAADASPVLTTDLSAGFTLVDASTNRYSISWTYTAAQTAAVTPRQYVYDVFVTNAGGRHHLLQGTLTVIDAVTDFTA